MKYDDEKEPTLRDVIRKRINDAIQDVYGDILKAFHKTGDDFMLPKDFDKAIDDLSEDLEFMVLNNPTTD